MLALPWLPDFPKLHKAKQCQLEGNQILAEGSYFIAQNMFKKLMGFGLGFPPNALVLAGCIGGALRHPKPHRSEKGWEITFRELKVLLHSCLRDFVRQLSVVVYDLSPKDWMWGPHREAKSRRTEARLVWGVCINKRLHTVTLRRIPAKRRIQVHRKVLTSFQLPPSKFFLVCGIRKSAGTQLPNSEHDPARIPKPQHLWLNLILTRHWGRLCWEK